MIDTTTLLIGRLTASNEREHERRYARRNRLRRIDGLLDQFELLNLRDERAAPRTLAHSVYGLAFEDEHPLLRQPLREISIAHWMDTLYDLQEPLLFGFEEIEDTTQSE